MGGSQQLIKKNLEFIKILPHWAQELSYKYCSKTANLYFIHGNIRDFLPHKMKEGEFKFDKVQEYIAEVLFGGDNAVNVIVYYDKSCGVSFLNSTMEKNYLETMKKFFPDATDATLLSSNSVDAFTYLEKYFLICISLKKRIVFLVDYAETIIPSGDITNLDETDRFCLVTLNRWSHEPVFMQGDVSVILLSENLSDVNIRITTSPSVVKVCIPLPDLEVRTQFVKFLEYRGLATLARGLSAEKMATLTSGLNLFHLNQIAQEAEQADEYITMEYLRKKKQEIIEREASGLLEFLETQHDLSFVSGHNFVKNRFKNAVRAIKQNQLDVLPMGYLISGPIGTGKSFLVSAFAGEIGIPMVRLKNFHSHSAGASETNLERVLNILKAMSPVAVMIDEADTFLGSREDKRGDGSASRIFAQIANFMGNTAYRGKIIWFLITSRPDLIPIDLKRQGRAEEHLALFYPESEEERIDLFEILKKKLLIKVENFPLLGLFKKLNFEVSGADIEAILVRAKMVAAMDKRMVVTKKDLEQTIQDFIPPTYPHEIELQNLVAVLECTSREMIPKRYQNMDRTKLASEIQSLKQLLGN
ncbi:MAG: ATP-binding protein [Treponema sp.]|nr:ATP-binding protein [Treponema sp.]